MRTICLFAIFLLAFASRVYGQCPTAGFTLPDSVCAGESFLITNTSASGTGYYWDLCPGDLTVSPASVTLPNNTALNAPQQIRLVQDGGNYYLFVANLSNNNLLRYDFGTSLDNIPTVYDYGALGQIAQPAGLDIVNDNGTWYALLVNYGPSNVVRVNLGTVIANNTATADNLGFFGLGAPIALRIAKENSDYFVFVSNSGGSQLTKITFTGTIASAPSGFTSLADAAFSGGWGFDLAYDCSLGKWIGFYASSGLNNVNVIDFGNSLTNSGSLAASIPTGGTPTAVHLVADGARWHLLATNIGGSQLQNFQFPGNLLSTPILTAGGISGLSSPRGITSLRDSVSIKVLTSVNNSSDIKLNTYQKPCYSNPSYSTDSVLTNPLIYAVGAYQEIALQVTGPGGELAFFSDSLYVQPTPIAGFLSSVTCEGDATQFTDTSITDTSFVTTWLWDFGDSSPVSNDTNPVHLFANAGTYAVSLTTSYAGGCSNTVVNSIEIFPRPSADFSFANNQCSSTDVNFTDLSLVGGTAVIVDWQWDFGDGSPADTVQHPVHVFDVPGTYTVLLTVTTDDGCSDTVSQAITIIPSPEAGFTVTSTCIGETASFTNTTSIQGGGNIDYDWDFGDSFTSTQPNPTHNYASLAANYDVLLVATAANGCVDSVTQNIRISNIPVAQFTWTPNLVCVGNTITLTSTSTGTGGDTLSMFIWDFGDGNTSNDENPFHAYQDTGFYDITLTVVSPTYCDSSVTQQIYVIPSPTATFTSNNVCLGGTTQFNPSITTPPGTVVDSIVWTFGDGNGFTGLSSPSHIYQSPGNYVVTMTVYNDLLCTGSHIDTLEVYPLPVAAFSTSILCSDSLATFDGTLSTVAGDTITGWLWDFDGLGSASGDTVTFAFPDSGQFEVTLIALTIHGCSDTLMESVSVIHSPEFDFSFNEPCLGGASVFTYLPDSLPAPSSTLLWNFGDGTSSALLSPSHIYTAIDTFFVSLTVMHNATGCITTVVQPLSIKPYPVAGFTLNNVCENVPVQLTDTSTIVSGSITSWNWDLGILGTSTVQNPVVTPPGDGLYPISLTVTSGFGCSSVVTGLLTAYANPVAAFTPDPLFGSPPLTVNFINQTIGGNQFNWTFGDNGTGTGQSPIHIYADTGIYTVTMVAISSEGCTDSVAGYVAVLIPYLDLAVNKVYASIDDDLIGLTAELINMGNIPITSFRITGIIENGSLINETWSGQLQPGANMMYEFVARYDINAREFPGYYCIDAILANEQVDDNVSNNDRCAVMSAAFEIYAAYPNPFNDELSIGLNLPAEGPFDVRIFDAAGKLVFEKQEVQGLQGYNKVEISTATFSRGVYALTIQYNDELKVLKLLNH